MFLAIVNARPAEAIGKASEAHCEAKPGDGENRDLPGAGLLVFAMSFGASWSVCCFRQP